MNNNNNNHENDEQPILLANDINIQNQHKNSYVQPLDPNDRLSRLQNAANDRAQAERNMQNEVSQIISRSVMLKFISGIVSIIKIIISSVFLSKYAETCNNSDYTNWIILMMLHDGLNIFYVGFYMIFSRLANRRTLMSEYESQISAQYQPLGEDGRNVQVNQNNNNPQDLVESQCKSLLVIKELNKIFYLAILLWAHLIYFIQSNNCEDGGSELKNLVLAYIILGYIYIFYPILIVISLCLCLPCLLFLVIYFGGSQQKPADKQIINTLNVKKYIKDEAPVGADPDCIICRVEYENGDNIITLPCNEMHFFHDECIKKWLKINGLCPLCRSRLQ